MNQEMKMHKHKLIIIHLNIRSIITDSKQIQLRNIINKHNPDIISINETFLKKHIPLEIEGYNIIRSDIQNRPGGGAALCIKTNLIYKEINLGNLIGNDNACGLSIQSSRLATAIFSIYSPPKEPLNSSLFDYIAKTHKHFIILGDLNAQNRLWHCKKENRCGQQLEAFINEHNAQIINNNSITYPSGKSIIDLTLISNAITTYKLNFKVLPDHISDHQPTLTTIKDFSLTREMITFRKTNWTLFTRTLEENPPDIPTTIATTSELDLAAETLKNSLANAFETSTKTITIKNKPFSIINVPDTLLKQIKLKRKLKRRLIKTHSEQLRRIFNMLNRKIKVEIARLKSTNLHTNFKALEGFKSSVSKHWKLLNNFNCPKQQNRNNTDFHHQEKLIDDDKEITKHFAEYLTPFLANLLQYK